MNTPNSDTNKNPAIHLTQEIYQQIESLGLRLDLSTDQIVTQAVQEFLTRQLIAMNGQNGSHPISKAERDRVLREQILRAYADPPDDEEEQMLVRIAYMQRELMEQGI